MKKIYLIAALIGFSNLVIAQELPHEKQQQEGNQGLLPLPPHLDPNVFADLKVLTYDASSINELTVKQKELVYYLSQAALSGREIIYAQNYKHNILIKRT